MRMQLNDFTISECARKKENLCYVVTLVLSFSNSEVLNLYLILTQVCVFHNHT